MKRLLDICVALFFLIILSPILLLVSIVIYFTLGAPVIFKQTRPGMNNKLFHIYKFRSMSNAVDVKGRALPDSTRLTLVGKFLRSSSLDELPALWNVLRGDMSLVGPRPLLVEYLPLYSPEQSKRHHVRPGITGWAQVNGRNAISWDEKFELDVWYVNNKSLLLDIKILFLTIKKVLFRADISHEGHATMPFFTGSKNTNEE